VKQVDEHVLPQALGAATLNQVPDGHVSHWVASGPAQVEQVAAHTWPQAFGEFPDNHCPLGHVKHETTVGPLQVEQAELQTFPQVDVGGVTHEATDNGFDIATALDQPAEQAAIPLPPFWVVLAQLIFPFEVLALTSV